ncbi:hypothetical protein BS47DRAFT_1385067 [Hydnum rufescens UP504]|uniref:NAD-dependent epimerase/dehydratase domain-containing protein n=1 Tax=Hydnum rufescens UP504 TaxID=1448309 RepID=A0A9P6DM58_9AGAM|nr:hypothetical protein BS47DRAFT_1385067 [Hydnum rufescens UP504]
MTPITSPSRILVTGANGYIATWIIKAILDNGHTVIGTVRSSSKGEYLRKLFGDKFSYTLVPNIGEAGAFDEAVKQDIDGVVHSASPVSSQGLTTGLSSGMLSVVQQISWRVCRNMVYEVLSGGVHRLGVKRVVLTSSVAACLEPKEGQYTYTETDWNVTSPKIVEKGGPEAGGHLYRASKVLAERAAWDFVKKQNSFDLVTILPTVVFGPVIQEVNGVDSLSPTPGLFWRNVTQTHAMTGKGLSLNSVDVRDVALAHAIALESPVAGGERFLLSAQPFQFQDQKDILREAGFTEIPEGVPGSGKTTVPDVIADGSKVTRVLGIKYRSHEEMVVDTYKSLKELLSK